MNSFDTWYISCRDWLEPDGYTLIYDNHPLAEAREYHWCKNGVRICCNFKWDLSKGLPKKGANNFTIYYYLYADIFMHGYTMYLQSQKFLLPTDVMSVLPSFIESKLKLE